MGRNTEDNVALFPLGGKEGMLRGGIPDLLKLYTFRNSAESSVSNALDKLRENCRLLHQMVGERGDVDVSGVNQGLEQFEVSFRGLISRAFEVMIERGGRFDQ